MKDLILVAALDSKGGIGKDGKIPWNHPLDMSFFRDLTTRNASISNVCIMGRKTWESLPPTRLPGRMCFVVSRGYVKPEENMKSSTWEGVMKMLENYTCPKFVIGGAEIYRLALPYVAEFYLTHVPGDYECDTFMPSLVGYLEGPQHIMTAEGLTFSHFGERDPHPEYQYLQLMKDCLGAQERESRNGKIRGLMGRELRFDLRKGFPLLTTKKLNLLKIYQELLMFVGGRTQTKELEEKGNTIWVENTKREFLDASGLDYPEGEMGPMYGFQWRRYGGDDFSSGIDQLQACINLLKKDPYSRRNIMTSYNPAQAKLGCLYPCHGIHIQFYVEQGRLNLFMSQRSADVCCGLPYNIASYALLLHMVAGVTDLELGELVLYVVDAHIYAQHYRNAGRQALRVPFPFPRVSLGKKEKIEDYGESDLVLENYKSYPFLLFKMVA